MTQAGLPSIQASRELVQGDGSQVVNVVGSALERSAYIAAGLAVTGRWSSQAWKNALVSSSAIQLGILLHALRGGQELPSWSPAVQLVRGDWKALGPIVFLSAARGVLMGAAMYAAGERKDLLEQSLAGSLAVEASVLLRAWRQR